MNINSFNILNNNPPQWHLVNSIDWNFINELNPDLIKKTRDTDSLQNLITFLNKIEISPDDQAIFNHPLTPRLFRLCQVLVDYLIYCQDSLSERLQVTFKENDKCKRKIKSLENTNQKMQIAYRRLSDAYKQANVVIDKLKIPREACPVCGKKFMEGGYLDKHFELKHKDLCTYWSAIRTQQPINVANKEIKELIDQIKELKEQTADQKKKYATARSKISRQEIEQEDPLESTIDELNDQFHDACDSLDSSVQLYRKKKVKPEVQINTANPFALFKQPFQPDYNNNLYQNTQTKYIHQDFYEFPQKQKQSTISTQPNQCQQQMPITVQSTMQIQHQPIHNLAHPSSHQNTDDLNCHTHQMPVQQFSQSPRRQFSLEETPNISAQTCNERLPASNKPINQAALLQAKNFLNPEYRQSKYKISEDRMEQMISQVSSRIQNAISQMQSVSSQQKKELNNQTIHNQLPQDNSKTQSNKPIPTEMSLLNKNMDYNQPTNIQQTRYDEDFSYNENSDSLSTPFMEEVNNPKLAPQQTVNTFQQNEVSKCSKKDFAVVQSGPVETKPKRIIHIPEEPQKPIEVYIKSIDNVEIKQSNNNSIPNDDSNNPFEIDSSFQSTTDPKPCNEPPTLNKHLTHNQKKRKEPESTKSKAKAGGYKTSNASEYPQSNSIKQIENVITNSELNDLLAYSESNSEEPKNIRKETSTGKTHTPNNLSKPLKRKTPKKESPNPTLKSASPGQVPFEEAPNNCGITITNSELNALLQETDADADVSNTKPLSKSVIDTFYQGDIDDMNDSAAKHENCDDHQAYSQLKELPKPPKRNISVRKFDFSFLNNSNL